MRVVVALVLATACGSASPDEARVDAPAAGADAAPAADAPPSGGDDVLVAMAAVWQVVLRDGFVYLGGTDLTGRRALFRVGVDGSGFVPLVEVGDDAGAFVIEGDAFFWIESGHHSLDFLDGALFRAPLAGGSATPLVDPLYFPADLGVWMDRVYWSEIDGQEVSSARFDGQDVRVDYAEHHYHDTLEAGERGVFFTAGAEVLRLPEGPSDPSPVAKDQVSPKRLLLAGDDLFWAAGNTLVGDPAVILRADLSSGAEPTLLIRDLVWVGGLAANATDLYASDSDAQKILRVPRQGGEVETVVAAPTAPGILAVDATHLVWADGDSIVHLRELPAAAE